MKQSQGAASRTILSSRGAVVASVILIGLLGFSKQADSQQAGSESPETIQKLSPTAQQFIAAARDRLAEKEKQEQEARLALELKKAEERKEALAAEMVREREKAKQLAVEAARKQLQRDTTREAAAQKQIEEARERQLKVALQRGQSLYHDARYQEAIETLEKIVVMAPEHPLAKAAERLIARADLKRFEQRLRLSAELPAEAQGAVVPELEDLLTHKRIEMDTLHQYAQMAIREKRYETATKLLTGILVQDPSNEPARKLLENVQMARLDEQQDQTIRKIELDEAEMINEVLRAQLIPPVERAFINEREIKSEGPDARMSAKLAEPISFEFNKVALADVLQFVADAANVSIVPSPGLDLQSQTVTMKVKQMPLEQAVKYLAKSLSLAYRVDRDAILIASAEEFSNEPLETRIFFLKHGLSPFALETAALESNPVMQMDPIKSMIEQAIPQPSDSRLVLDERSGALIVTNTGENLALTERLLGQLDITPVQVLIEARFVELTLTNRDESGFEWLLNSGLVLDKTTEQGSTRTAAQEIASGGGSTFAASTRETEGLNLTLEGILTGTQFETVVHFLEENQRSKTLSAPRVTALNNQTATIRVVDEFRYPTRYEVSLIQFDGNGDGDFDDAGETEFANVPQDFQKRDIGILLHVTPSVGNSMDSITLVMSPEVSQFSQFRSLGGGVTVPEFTSSQLTTSVVIEPGQVVVLGGLMTDTTSKITQKVPFLADLPLLGGLFRQSEDVSTRKSLVIFVTARILAPRGETT